MPRSFLVKQFFEKSSNRLPNASRFRSLSTYHSNGLDDHIDKMGFKKDLTSSEDCFDRLYTNRQCCNNFLLSRNAHKQRAYSPNSRLLSKSYDAFSKLDFNRKGSVETFLGECNQVSMCDRSNRYSASSKSRVAEFLTENFDQKETIIIVHPSDYDDAVHDVQKVQFENKNLEGGKDILDFNYHNDPPQNIQKVPEIFNKIENEKLFSTKQIIIDASRSQNDTLSKSKSGKPPRTFSCKYCVKDYMTLGALKMHIRTHTLPCKCPMCGKAFSRPWLLQGHVRTHTGEKPFKCSHCSRAFADRSNQRAHMQTHFESKKLECSKCCKTFIRFSQLSKHVLIGCDVENQPPVTS
ncbi:protein snail homolog Sna [Hydra vulgaris]|uniref:Zinc finger protein SNAI3 n=1 Tax=Hydra vulgaris TaxID=6087 RepID=T2MCI4_HYDVU|nr:protein snail homolog Sna [Hydra vulgaris]